MSNKDEVVITLRLAEVQRFVSEGNRAEGALKDVGDEVDHVDKKSRIASAASGGFGLLRGVMGAIVKTSAALAVGVGAAAISLGTVAVSAASNLNETLNKTDQIFNKQSPALKAWAATAAVSLGESQDQALTAAANYGNLFHNLGATDKAAAKMSKTLVTTAADLASFNNASPEEMLDALSSALAGEYDPLQRYGFAITAAAVQHKALQMGLAKTKASLSAADTAQASYALILEQTGKAHGDFGKTSSGLANQQRILAAQFDNLKAKIGTAFLPAVLSGANALTSELLPVISDLADDYGPRLTDWVTNFATNDAPKFVRWILDVAERDGPKIIGWFRNLHMVLPQGKVAADLSSIGDSIRSIAHSAAGSASTGIHGLSDSLTLAAVAAGWLADHTDLLAKAMPYLVAGFVLYKSAQIAATAAEAVAVPLKIAEIVVNLRLAASQRLLARSIEESTLATGASSAVTAEATAVTGLSAAAAGRGRLMTLVSTVAMKGAAVASTVLAGGLRLLSAAWLLATGPIGLIVIGVIAAIAVFVLMYKKVGWFRNGVNAAMHGVVVAARFAWNWIKHNWPLLLAILIGPTGIAVLVITRNLGKIKSGFKWLVNEIIHLWNSLDLSISIPGWLSKVPGVPDGVAGHTYDLIPDVPMLWQGGTATEAGAAIVGDRGPELIHMPRGATVRPLDPSESGAGADRVTRVVQVILDRKVLAEAVMDGRDDKAARR